MAAIDFDVKKINNIILKFPLIVLWLLYGENILLHIGYRDYRL